MSLQKVLFSGASATTAMTLFSFIVSDITGKHYKETDLLKRYLQKPGMKEDLAAFIAWTAHYTVGELFAMLYHLHWKKKNEAPSAANGALLGACSGVIAILTWKKILQTCPNLKLTNRSDYYRHLLIAHIVFGIVAAGTYRKIDSKEKLRD
jgi:hypothetical protein